MLFKKLTVSFVFFLSMLFNIQVLFADTVIPGGDSIGINLSYEGVLITGGYEITVDDKQYNPLENGFAVGDIIVEASGNRVDSIAVLTTELKEGLKSSNTMELKVQRDESYVTQVIEIMYNEETEQFSTGLYVKDSLMGVGTMTYYNPETQSFGSLGHAMADTELDDQALLKSGTIFRSSVTGIKRGTASEAGQKIATISDIEIGTIDDHSAFGIYGKYDKSAIGNRDTMETASVSEVKLGKAYFLTVLHGEDIVEVEIEITELDSQDTVSQKGITFKITDQSVITQTSGIVQGMSGSPIIQDGKLIGCVTHVSSGEQTTGYGLYIDWMLEMDKQQ